MPISPSIALQVAVDRPHRRRRSGAAISWVVIPSGWARSSATTRVSRARRSRLPDLGPRPPLTASVVRSAWPGGHDAGDRCAPRSVAVRLTRIVAWSAPSRMSAGVAVDAAGRSGRAGRRRRPSSRARRASVRDRRRRRARRPAGTPPERRAVDRDPAVAGPGALDDVDAVDSAASRDLRRQGGRERLDVDRAVGDVGELARRHPLNGSRTHASRRRSGAAPWRPSSLGRRGVGQPAEVGAGAVAGEVDRCRSTGRRGRPSRCSSSRARRPDRDRGRRTAAARASPVGRAEPRRRRRLVAEGELVGHRDRREDAVPAPTARTVATSDAAGQAPAPHRGLAEERRAIPKPGEQARAEQREDPRVGRLDRRQQRLGAALDELVGDVDDRRDEHEQRPEAEPDHRRERRRSPRAAGGQTIAAKAISDGPSRGQPDDDVDRSAGPVAEQDDRPPSTPSRR